MKEYQRIFRTFYGTIIIAGILTSAPESYSFIEAISGALFYIEENYSNELTPGFTILGLLIGLVQAGIYINYYSKVRKNKFRGMFKK